MFNKLNIGGVSQPKNTFNNRKEHQNTQANKKDSKKDSNSLQSMLQKRSNPENSIPESSKKQKLNDGDHKKKLPQGKQSDKEIKHNDAGAPKRKGKEDDLTKRIEEGLIGSKFRMINEYFYTTDSKTSASHFAKHKDEFLLYHQGFQSQIQKWPEKPVDMIIRQIDTSPFYQNAVIADLGCGDGKIYEYFRDSDKLKALNPKISKGMKEIHSFDLCSHKDFIKVSDSKSIPLDKASCDVVVFCLALMGTNYIDFLAEARRLLKIGGHLIISEVNSRIPNMDLFIAIIEALGFKLQKKVLPNTYFCLLTFKKQSESTLCCSSTFSQINAQFKTNFSKEFGKVQESTRLDQIAQALLKPCIYKKR